MLTAYYSRGCDSRELFQGLKIATHPDFEKHWSSEWQQRYRKILMAADYVKVICPVFSMSSYQLRNEWMVNHSSLLIAVYNGRAGGTRNTIEYANKCHVEVHMLYIHEQLQRR